MGRRDPARTSEHSERESNSKADGRRYDSSVSDAATTPAATLKITGECGDGRDVRRFSLAMRHRAFFLFQTGRWPTFNDLCVHDFHCVGNASEIKSPGHPALSSGAGHYRVPSLRTLRISAAGSRFPPHHAKSARDGDPGFAHARNAPQVYRLPVGTAPARS